MKTDTRFAMPDDEQGEWEAYRARRDPRVRAALMHRYFNFLQHKAKQLKQRLPDVVDEQDLVQAGAFGLADAVDRFDPNRGFKFTTFAGSRVHGSMIDWLRRNDHLSRDARAGGAVTQRILSIDRDRDMFGDRASTLVNCLTDKRAGDDVRRIDGLDQFNVITRVLPQRMQLPLTMYFIDELKMREIAAVIGCSEGRVSELLTQAKTILAAHLTSERKLRCPA